jgi:hypothetical protein
MKFNFVVEDFFVAEKLKSFAKSDDSVFTKISSAARGDGGCRSRLHRSHKLGDVFFDGLRALIHDFVDCRFLVARSRHDVLVIG